MSKQVGDYFWTKIKENYHINDSKFSSSHSEKVFSYTWLLSNSLDQSGHQQHHTTRPIEFLLDTGFGLLLNVEHCHTIMTTMTLGHQEKKITTLEHCMEKYNTHTYKCRVGVYDLTQLIMGGCQILQNNLYGPHTVVFCLAASALHESRLYTTRNHIESV